jgi:predicted aminopeptidase
VPNNALLASIVTYSEWLPAFRHLLLKHNGDLDALYREAKRLAAMDRPARQRALRDLM